MSWWHAGSAAHKVNNAYRVKIRMFLRSNIQPDRKTGCFPGLHLQLPKLWSWPLKARYVTGLVWFCIYTWLYTECQSWPTWVIKSSCVVWTPCQPFFTLKYSTELFSRWNDQLSLSTFTDLWLTDIMISLGNQATLCFLFMLFICVVLLL